MLPCHTHNKAISQLVIQLGKLSDSILQAWEMEEKHHVHMPEPTKVYIRTFRMYK
jgi:hypothetical protein